MVFEACCRLVEVVEVAEDLDVSADALIHFNQSHLPPPPGIGGGGGGGGGGAGMIVWSRAQCVGSLLSDRFLQIELECASLESFCSVGGILFN